MATKKKNKYLESISKSASKIESNKEKYAQKEQYDEDTLFGSARSTISENRLRESNNIGESPYKNLSIIRANRQKEEEEAQGSIFDIARNNIASGAASYNRAEKSYMDSLPNDAYRFAYQQSKNTDGVYVSPYFSKGIEGKEKLTYNNDEWNKLSEGERKKYLEWAQDEIDNGKKNDVSSNKYLNYAKRIIMEAKGGKTIAGSVQRGAKQFSDSNSFNKLIARAVGLDKVADATLEGTFDADREKQIMFQMLPDEVKQELLHEGASMTNDIIGGLKQTENVPGVGKFLAQKTGIDRLDDTSKAKAYLEQYYSPEDAEMLIKYGQMIGSIRDQQERNERTAELMKNPIYATVGAPLQQIATDLVVKPIAGATDFVSANLEADKGIRGVFNPYDTAPQKLSQEARYINQSILEGLQYGIDIPFTENEKLEKFAGKAAQFSYNTSVSAAESAIRTYMANTGGAMFSRTMPFVNAETASKVLLTGMMSTAVFNDDLNENIQKGMPLDDAISSAMAHSIFESLFEEISLDKLGYFQEAPVLRSKKEFVKQLMKAGFVEGSEEAFTDIANELYDHYVGNYDYSEYKAFKDNYLAENPDATDAEIWWNFTKQFSWQVAQSFAGGALSSFALSSTKGMKALRRGETYIQNGKNVTEADYIRMNSFVEEMAAVNPSIMNQLTEATEGGIEARKGFVKMVTDEYSEEFNKAIEQADTKDKLNIVMNNANAALHGAISEDTFNVYNAKLVELGETPADYNTFVQNRAKTSAETTFSDLAYGRGDNAISRNIVEASKSIAETQENANMDKSVREETIKKLTEKVETNVKKAEEMVARYAEMGVPMDSPEVRQFESVLGLQNMAQMYSAGKLAAQNLNLPATTQKSGKLYQVKQNSAEAKRIFKENAKHIIEAPFEEVKTSTAYSLGKVISRMTGMNIGFYKSDRQAIQNGAYDAKTNTLYLDVNAGTSGSNYAIGEVFSHELTHWIRANNEEGYQKLMDFIKTDMGAEAFESLVKDHIEKGGLDENVASEEVVAEACQRMLENSEVFKRYAAQDLEGAETLLQRLVDFIRKLREAFKGSLNNEATRLIEDLEGLQKEWDAALSEAIGEKNAEMSQEAAEGILENNPKVAEEIVGTELVTDDSVKLSQRLNGELMEKAEKEFNKTIEVNGVKTTLGKSLGISYRDFYNAVSLCNTVAQRMKTDLAPYLPEDNPGKVEVGNASYGRSMENALVCIRSIVNNDFTDMVSEELGRPLTVEEQLVASQILQIVNSRPECNYCYVATDRRAYRASFGTYFNQYSNVYDKVAQNREAFGKDLPGAEKRMETVKVDNGDKNNGTGVVAQAYAEFLNGRKNTPDMRKRFLAWVKSAVNGEKPISLKDLSSAKMRDAAREDSAKKWFIYDSENYAQKATWAKKTSRTLKINGEKYVADYVSYNGSILKWSDDLVKKLNSEFGMRMYSFSDYVPAFLLENMQMIIDASLRGLKVLAYTKDCGFAEAFADTGAGINISLFGTLSAQAQKDENLNRLREQYKKTNSDADRKAYLSALDKYVVKDGIGGKDGMMGANWERAASLRKTYGNVGTVFVATNDDLVEWALANPDIDVVIPYHLVRTGEEVASFFNYKNYKAAQEDKKQKEWAIGNLKAVPPTVHKNSLELYKKALADNKLTARFSDYIDNPNYMKLVNETRMSYEQLQPVQPIFDQETIMRELGRIKDEGQYGLMPGFKTKAEQDAFIENQNLVGQAVDAIGEWNESGKKPIDDTKYSSRGTERDSEYMSAVNSGDMETAQKYVDEAAKEAGYDSEKLYHGTSGFGFTVIDTKKSNDRISFFATDSEETAGSYSGTKAAREIGSDSDSNMGIYQLYANTDGMLEFDANGMESNHIALGNLASDYNYMMNTKSWSAFATAKQLAKYAKAKGATGVIIRNVIDSANTESRKNLPASDVYVFLNPTEQVKSADPVTYDDNGNVIPLSERFNKENEDIRYSERGVSAELLMKKNRGLTQAQAEFLEGTQLVDENGRLRKFVSFKLYDAGFSCYPIDSTKNAEYIRSIKPWYVSEHGSPSEIGKEELDKIKKMGFDSVVFDIPEGQEAELEVTRYRYAKMQSGEVYTFDSSNILDRENKNPEKPVTTVTNKTEYKNTEDSIGEKLSNEQIEFFKDSEARDGNGNLLRLYSGTSTGGFTEFMDGKIWLTTEYESARAYGGAVEGNNFAPGRNDKSSKKEPYSVEKRIEVQTASEDSDNFYFDSQADLDAFEKKVGGKVSDYMNEDELDSLVYEAYDRETDRYDGKKYDEYEKRKKLSEKIRKEYVKYDRDHLRYTTIAELLKNPDIYTRQDFVRAMYALDSNAIVDEDGLDSKETLAQTLIDNYNEYNDENQSLDDYYDIGVLARVPEGTTTTADTYNDSHMVYELYANVKNPYIVDNGGKRLNENGSSYYSSVDYAYKNRDIYDGCIIKNVEVGPVGSGLGTTVVAFSPNQVKSVNNENPTEDKDIRYSLRDLANSESEIIVNALANDEALVESLGAKQSIESYAREYNKLKDMEQQAIEISKQLRKKGTTPSEREVLLKKMVRLDRAILNKTTELTEMRNQRVIRDLLVNEWDKRDTMVAAGRAEERLQTRKALEEKYGKELKALRAKSKAKQTEIRNRFEINKRKKNIETKAKALMKMILNPTEKKHIPSVLVNPITDLLDSIDYWTPAEGRPTTKKSESLRTRFEDFRSAINEYQKQIDDGAEQIELMFDPEFLETVDDLCNSVKGIDNVNDMSVQDIIDLDHTLTELLHLISRGNKMIKAYHYETIKDAVDATAETMDKLDTLSSKTSAKGNLRMRLNAGMADSYAFGRYAGDGTKQIIDSLSKAFEEKISKVKQAIEFTQEVLKPYKKDLKKWSKDTHEFTLSTTDANGNPNKVSLTVGQMMELYLLNKREQARGHIYGGGIRVEDRKGRYTESVKVTEEDVQEIVNYLATVPGAIEVAEKLQKYGATTITGWGNEASNLMYGFAKFTEPDYWQIRSDSSALKDNENTEAALNASMYRLQNMGRTKAVKKGANNAIYVGDVFDTWSKTIDEMTSYASILPSTTDAMRWWNSRIVNESGDAVRIKKLLESKLGTDMTKVFTETIKALNGGIMGTDSLESLVKVLTGKAKAAAVAGNLRVVLQQPTAYTRAAAVIEPKYLLKALKMKPNAKEAQEHSAIAWHKAQGFYSNGLAPSLRKLVIGDGSFGENLTEKSLWLAGKADDITWGALWNASKLKVEDENKALKKGSDEYWEEVNKVFSDIINNTQVVDTPLTKSTWMRGNGLGVFFTAFMAEPTKTYSMVMTAVEDLVRNPKSKQAQKTVALVGTVFAVNAAVNALAQALADAARDDDKEKSYWEKYVEKYTEDIKDNLNPLTYIPVVKDIFSLWNGYSNNNLAMQAAQNTVYAVQELQKIAKGTSKKTLFGQMETCAKAVSSWTGIPFGNVMRTFNSFGNIVGIDTFRRKKYTKSELGRNVVLSIKEGNTAEATEYWNQLVREVGEDEISEAYGYISTYLAEHDDNVDAYAVAFLEDANNLETQAEDLMRKYEYNEYITLDVATDAIRKAARADQKAEAEAKGEKYKQTVSSTNSGGTIYNSSDVNRALERGNIDEAQKVIDKINAGYKTQGSNSTAKSAVSNYWKPKYLSATGAERDRIARMLYKLKNNGKQMFSSKDLQKWVSDANKSNK